MFFQVEWEFSAGGMTASTGTYAHIGGHLLLWTSGWISAPSGMSTSTIIHARTEHHLSFWIRRARKWILVRPSAQTTTLVAEAIFSSVTPKNFDFDFEKKLLRPACNTQYDCWYDRMHSKCALSFALILRKLTDFIPISFYFFLICF